MQLIKQGYAVQIRREDGSTFLSSAGVGDVSPVWCKRNRRYAVDHKRDLRKQGFNAKVVEVLYMIPEVS